MAKVNADHLPGLEVDHEVGEMPVPHPQYVLTDGHLGMRRGKVVLECEESLRGVAHALIGCPEIDTYINTLFMKTIITSVSPSSLLSVRRHFCQPVITSVSP